jgi:hypothetical protein
MAVIPEVLNRDPFFQEVARTWIPAFAGMTTFYEFISFISQNTRGILQSNLP